MKNLVFVVSMMSSVAHASVSLDVPCENQSERKEGAVVDHLVLHCVGMSEEWVLNNFAKSAQNGGAGVSAHYYVPPSGDATYRFVSEDKKAWHAGVSKWTSRSSGVVLVNLNDFSVGIEVGCEGYGHYHGGVLYPFSFSAYSEPAIQRAMQLSKAVMIRRKIPSGNVVWHSDISPFRILEGKLVLGKTDPGPTFPAKLFAEYGIGLWPLEDREDEQLSFSMDAFTANLRRIGFCFDATNELETLYAAQAFIMHYSPDDIRWDSYSDIHYDTIAKGEQGPIWQGDLTDNMVVRAHNLAKGLLMYGGGGFADRISL